MNITSWKAAFFTVEIGKLEIAHGTRNECKISKINDKNITAAEAHSVNSLPVVNTVHFSTQTSTNT